MVSVHGCWACYFGPEVAQYIMVEKVEEEAY